MFRHVAQFAGVLDEQGHAVGQELLCGQGARHAQFTPEEVDGAADLCQLHAVVTADHRQQMKLAKVDEGQLGVTHNPFLCAAVDVDTLTE